MAPLVVPRPGVIAAALFVTRNARIDSDTPVYDLFFSLARDMDDSSASYLPVALGRLLRIMEGDPDRLGLLVDTIATFDLYEALPDLLDLAVRSANPEVILAAAKLVQSPGATEADRKAIRRLADDAQLSERALRALAIRLDPQIVPSDRLEALLHAELWPGSDRATREEVAPQVAIDEDGAPARLKWLLYSDLHAAGAAIRRIPKAWQSQPFPEWLGSQEPVITWKPQSFGRVLRAFPALSSGQLISIRDDDSGRVQAIHLLGQRLPSASGFHPKAPPLGAEFANPVSPDVFKLGTFDAHEMALLSGTRKAALYGHLREALPPAHRVRGEIFWSFNQLVGLRTWQYFRSQAKGGRLDRKVITDLAEMAGASSPTSVGVTFDSRVLRLHDSDWVDVTTDEVYFDEVRTLDTVFEQFTLGGGASDVPALLGPSWYSKVHPVLLGGSPAVVGTRVPVRSVAALHNDQGPAAVGREYGLSSSVIADVLPLGQRLIHA